MINFNNHLFATYQITGKDITITCDRDADGNAIPTDVMPFLTKDKLTYLYNVEIQQFYSENDGKIIINGIEMEGNNGSSTFSLQNILVKSFKVTNDCNFNISYCL